MSMDEITAYLMSGKLDLPDPELDVYRHLKVGLPAGKTVDQAIVERYEEEGLPDLNSPAATAAVLKLDHVDPPEASTAVSNSSDFVSVIEPVKVQVVVNEKATATLKAAAKKTAAPVSKGKRGRKDQHDVSALKVGDHIVYEGILSSARVMASLKGKKYNKKRAFKATEVGKEIRITRIL